MQLSRTESYAIQKPLHEGTFSVLKARSDFRDHNVTIKEERIA